MRPVDEKATGELEEDKVQGYVGDREVIGYAVRGPFLVIVSSDEDGFSIKQAFALDEKKAEKLTARQEPTPAESDDDDDDSDDDQKTEAKSSGGTARATATATAKK